MEGFRKSDYATGWVNSLVIDLICVILVKPVFRDHPYISTFKHVLIKCVAISNI